MYLYILYNRKGVFQIEIFFISRPCVDTWKYTFVNFFFFFTFFLFLLFCILVSFYLFFFLSFTNSPGMYIYMYIYRYMYFEYKKAPSIVCRSLQKLIQWKTCESAAMDIMQKPWASSGEKKEKTRSHSRYNVCIHCIYTYMYMWVCREEEGEGVLYASSPFTYPLNTILSLMRKSWIFVWTIGKTSINFHWKFLSQNNFSSLISFIIKYVKYFYSFYYWF